MDLFGDVSVTEADIELWLDSIKQLSAIPSRQTAYAKAYNVIQKSAQLNLKDIGRPI